MFDWKSTAALVGTNFTVHSLFCLTIVFYLFKYVWTTIMFCLLDVHVWTFSRAPLQQ